MSDDVLALYARAGETGDADLVASLFAEGGALRSPIFARFVFRGREDIRELMSVVYRHMRDVRFSGRAREGNVAFLTARSRIWGFRLEEAFAFDLDHQDRIKTVTIHIRPLVALGVLTVALGLGMARHPGVVLRAARGG